MTSFEKVYDQAMITIVDYKIDSLAKVDFDAFLTYLRSLLIGGIPEFETGSLSELDYTSVVEKNEQDEDKTVWYFVNDLTNLEISILAKTIVLKWWEAQTQKVTAFQPHLSTKDFKQLQESQSLKQKMEYHGLLQEDLGKAIVSYQLKNIDKLPFFGEE